MKRVLFAVILFCSSNILFAQVNKGQWLVGGSASFTTSRQGDADASKYTTFSLSPNAGYFFIDQFAAGLRVNVQSTKYKTIPDPYSSYAISPFARYYFLPAAQPVNVFADASYGFGSMKSGGVSNSFNQYAISAGPAFFLTPHTALELALQYRSSGGDAYANDRQNQFGLNVGFQVHLGHAAAK